MSPIWSRSNAVIVKIYSRFLVCNKMRKGHWSPVEDAVIVEQMQKNASWTDIVRALGGKRTTKQCRERWSNHLDPTLKKTKWTSDEDMFLIDAQARLGNCWTRIAMEMPGRSENEVKNRWYSTVHKFVSVGSKRKERDFAYEIENSPQDFEANSNFEHLHKTRFTEIEKEIYSFIQDVHLFLHDGISENIKKDNESYFAQIGNEYLERHQCSAPSTTLTKDTLFCGGSTSADGTTSSSSTGFDFDMWKDFNNFADIRTGNLSSPAGSFFLGISLNPSPAWFGLPSQPPSPPELVESVNCLKQNLRGDEMK